MSKYSKDQEKEIRRAIRDIIAVDPLASITKIQEFLKKRGFKTASGNALHADFVSKLKKKAYNENLYRANRMRLVERIAETKEMYRIIYQRLAKIAFWGSGFFEDKEPRPKNSEIISACYKIVQLDLALLNAEVSAGIYDKAPVEKEKKLSKEQLKKIDDVMVKWGLLLKKKTNND